jgi:hypothetical protein
MAGLTLHFRTSGNAFLDYAGAIVDPIVKRDMLPVLSFKIFRAACMCHHRPALACPCQAGDSSRYRREAEAGSGRGLER